MLINKKKVQCTSEKKRSYNYYNLFTRFFNYSIIALVIYAGFLD